ncbi:MAG: hypothetical protein DI636_00955 [Pelagerythrobacter marensis]|nr:MAG: hypothetical protein DI636_00955 [Pelagerythrobacter marensis]
MSGLSAEAETQRQRALALDQAGDVAGAYTAIREAERLAPHAPEIHTTAGNLALRAGRIEDAIAAFERAVRLSAVDAVEPSINLAIALDRAGRPLAAVRVLDRVEAAGRLLPRYCSARAAIERAGGDLAAAQHWYDACLARDPRHVRARAGRARIALERSAADAIIRYDRALEVAPGDAQNWLGKAMALEAHGRREEARALVAQLLAQAPEWLDALRLMAQIRLAQGEADFTADYRTAASLRPDDQALALDWAATLSGVGRDEEALRVSEGALMRFGLDSPVALATAIYAGLAGQHDRAEALWQTLPEYAPERLLHEARHRLRRQEPERAAAMLERLVEMAPDNVAGWALLDVAWRMMGDPRHQWLHGQDGLVAFRPLEGAEDLIDRAEPVLDALHDVSSIPLGQSVRGGSQTRGGLFDRDHPVLAELDAAIRRTLETHRAGLPPRDENHPLLRHRAAPWTIKGSWSVRLAAGGGAHIGHIHSEGVVSSALYIRLPADSRGGLLEIGRPAADLATGLPPLVTLTPRRGWLALFPSTLYHGTTPFDEGSRMTVAFDVTPAAAH